ncbi:MAG TPA: hypothetical protein VNT25_01675 [Allosphingosinicella sp.]|nr:hypothetical protein [Allosphingosinicella sp.]
MIRRNHLLLTLALAASACGGGEDAVAEPEEAASGAAVNAAVNQAQQGLEAANDRVEARHEAENRVAMDQRREAIVANQVRPADINTIIPPAPSQ